MNAVERAAILVEPYRPCVPIEELILQLNVIFHRYEAGTYDGRHPEIFSELPDVWKKLYQAAGPFLPQRPLRVLDYGCGTGFASAQFVSLAGRDRIAELVCYDPSKEMLEHCRERFSHTSPKTKFVSTVPELSFDVVLTNALLHHLPNIPGFLKEVSAALAFGGLWIQGHEPNRTFYEGSVAGGLIGQCRREAEWQKLTSVSWYIEKLTKRIGWQRTPETFTSLEAFSKGLVSKRLPPRIVAQLVDVGVPNSFLGGESGVAFHPSDAERFDPAFRVVWSTSYNFKGRYHGYRFSAALEEKLTNFAVAHPDAGANISSVIVCRHKDQSS